MKRFRYIEEAPTLELDEKKCIGCGLCTLVCPHRILTHSENKAAIVDPGGCMECGACAQNCPVEAITVSPGVGCAAYIIGAWLARIRKKPSSSVCC